MRFFSKSFCSNGYLRQGGKNESFVVKTPREKLHFLEAIAFSGVPISIMKTKAHDLRKDYEKQTNRQGKEISFVEGRLKDCTCTERPKLPLYQDKPGYTIGKAERKLAKLKSAMEKLEGVIDGKDSELQIRLKADIELASMSALEQEAQSKLESVTRRKQGFPEWSRVNTY